MLCDVCLNIHFRLQGSSQTGPYAPSWIQSAYFLCAYHGRPLQDLTRSAAAGCYFCHKMWIRMTSFLVDLAERQNFESPIALEGPIALGMRRPQENPRELPSAGRQGIDMHHLRIRCGAYEVSGRLLPSEMVAGMLTTHLYQYFFALFKKPSQPAC